MYQLCQIILRRYSALSGECDNATTGHAFTSNEVHARNVAGPGNHIRTAYRASEPFMRSYFPIPFQVIFQGKGSVPTIWVAVIAPLIEKMKVVGHVIKF